MNEALSDMLKKYTCHNAGDYANALKEVIQEISLLGLWRAKFFEKAAFYGGTALRILYALDRFSEDLDFSLLAPDPAFKIDIYLGAISDELESFGLKVSIERKEKTKESAIQSAFVKTTTMEHLLIIGMSRAMGKKIHPEDLLKVRLEIDTDPPEGFSTEAKYLLTPSPFSVRTYSPSDLFAGKLHALLCREWKGRIKGRDWYDFLWFIEQRIPVHLRHLELRLKQTGHLPLKETLNRETLLKLLKKRIHSVNFDQAKEDVITFLKDPRKVEIWSPDFFEAVSSKLTAI